MKNFIVKMLAFIALPTLFYAAEAPPQDIGKRLLDTEIQRINKAFEEEVASREWMKTSWNKEKRDYYPTAIENAKRQRDYFLQEAQELYPWYEANSNYFKARFPKYEVAGNLTYFMTLAEMANTVKAKFTDMYRKGQIMTRKEFEKQDTSKWFSKGEALTRIWGAEYLSKKFKENNRKDISVPHYIIVIDDPKKIEIGLWFGECYPIISQIINGQIYAEKIEGKEIAQKGMSLVGYGYTDYSSPGNIIKTNEGIYYPVDTEYKSFYDAMPQNYLFKNMNFEKGGYVDMCKYFKNRFELLNPGLEVEKVIEFSVLN